MQGWVEPHKQFWPVSCQWQYCGPLPTRASNCCWDPPEPALGHKAANTCRHCRSISLGPGEELRAEPQLTSVAMELEQDLNFCCPNSLTYCSCLLAQHNLAYPA